MTRQPLLLHASREISRELGVQQQLLFHLPSLLASIPSETLPICAAIARETSSAAKMTDGFVRFEVA